MRHVIVGAGIAGTTAAQTVRSMDKKAEIILIGKEQFLPYKRHLLTEYLCEKVDEENLFYFDCPSFRQHDIIFRKGQFIKSIHAEHKQIKLNHNEIIGYDKLLIATGGGPQLGPVLRPFKKNLQQYYSLEDVLLLKRQLEKVNDCVVFGQGLSTLDLLAGMHNLGKDVTYIVKGEKAYFPLLDKEVNEEIHQFLNDKGIRIIAQDRPVSIKKAEKKYIVSTLEKREIKADIVFGWDYYQPNIDFIEGSPIEKSLGILVDQYLQTSAEDIFAAGDCVEIYHPEFENYWINFGYPNAKKQGEIAGKNMVGKKEKYKIQDTIPFKIMGKPLKARWWG